MTRLRPALGVLLLALAAGGSVYAYYRAGFNHSRRLREVTAGRVYRSGQLTADGFADAVARFGIRAVVNLQEEDRDPFVPASYLGRTREAESEVLRRLGVKYIALDGGVLDADPATGGAPKLVGEFHKVLDDPSNYPMLIHCKAGLHRTGLLTAVYRMEVEHRPKDEVVRELRANGFGTYAATNGNIYIKTYIDDYQPRSRTP